MDAYEDMTDEGHCGLASPVGDAEAFGENLKSLCRDPALETKGKDAFTHAQAVYDMPKNVARLHTLLFGDMETVSLLQYEEEELYHRHEEVYWKDIPADFFKPVRNRSRLCLYSEDGTPSAYALCQKLRMLNPGRELLLNLLIGMLLHFPGTSSLRVLEIGCGRGELSPLISGAAAGFYSGNRYTAVTDCLGGENEDRWTANVTRADFPAGISYLIADFADTNLQTASFELVLINGWRLPFQIRGQCLPRRSVFAESRVISSISRPQIPGRIWLLSRLLQQTAVTCRRRARVSATYTAVSGIDDCIRPRSLYQATPSYFHPMETR